MYTLVHPTPTNISILLNARAVTAATMVHLNNEIVVLFLKNSVLLLVNENVLHNKKKMVKAKLDKENLAALPGFHR